MPVVFTLQICVFMTCSTSYSLYDTLLDLWNVSMYVWTPLKPTGKETALGKDLQRKVVLKSLHSGI